MWAEFLLDHPPVARQGAPLTSRGQHGCSFPPNLHALSSPPHCVDVWSSHRPWRGGSGGRLLRHNQLLHNWRDLRQRIGFYVGPAIGLYLGGLYIGELYLRELSLRDLPLGDHPALLPVPPCPH